MRRALARAAACAAALLASPFVPAADGTSFEARRRALVAQIASQPADAHDGRIDARVLAAIGRVPRHVFVPPEAAAHAYEDRPLSIGHGQTISQPYVVALMTHLAAIGKDERVLEVGTGSGYQAAVLAEMGAKVWSIEIVEALARQARERLRRLGYDVTVIAGDGYAGLPAEAPFDAIVVTAAPDHVPPALVAQLKPGGRMVIPVGPVSAIQSLTLIEKGRDGRIASRDVVPVRFVPLTRKP